MAPLYAQLLVEAAARLGPTDAFYSLWPIAIPPAPWAAVFTRLYKEVLLLSCRHWITLLHPA